MDLPGPNGAWRSMWANKYEKSEVANKGKPPQFAACVRTKCPRLTLA